MNLGLIIWFIMGGLILHFFMANFLNMVLMVHKDEAIDSPEKIKEHGLTPILVPGGTYYKEFLDGSPIDLYREIGKRAVMAKDWDDWVDLIRRKILGENTHVLISSDLCCGLPYNAFTPFPVEGLQPWYVWIINKKWALKEELTKHILLFQQVIFLAKATVGTSLYVSLRPSVS